MVQYCKFVSWAHLYKKIGLNTYENMKILLDHVRKQETTKKKHEIRKRTRSNTVQLATSHKTIRPSS